MNIKRKYAICVNKNRILFLDQLDEKTLKMILTEPKNAILKQYKCLLEMDGVQLDFEPKPTEVPSSERLSIILSKPTNAPPTINKILLVSI